MVLYDLRCRDVAKLISKETQVITVKQLKREIHELYPTLGTGRAWIRNVLIKWNPFITVEGNIVKLTPLGKAIASLPGEAGSPLTNAEKIFLLGVIMSDPQQKIIASELLVKGKTSKGNKWVVTRTKRCLKALGFI